MSVEILRQLQSIARRYTLQGFDVVIIAFGRMFNGTIISPERFKHALDKKVATAFQALPINDPFSYNVVQEVREGLKKAIISTVENDTDAKLYLSNVAVDGEAASDLLTTISYDDIQAWSLVGARTLEVIDSN